MTLRRLFRDITAAALMVVGLSTSAPAQSPFSPAVLVNDQVVSHYEIDQRALLLRIMRIPGDTRRLAREQLIDERLQQGAAAAAGFAASEEGLQLGLEQFAARANLEPEEMLAALQAEGVSRQTVEEFVLAQLLWQSYVQARFGGAVQVTEEEIDRAIASNTQGGINLLLSEIVIPVTPQTYEEVNALAVRLSEISTIKDFEAAARQYSQAATRDNGGRIDWMSVTKLPPELRPLIVSLGPGEVSDPVELPNAVALFQMRAKAEAARPAPRYAAVEYAKYYIPGGRSPSALAEAEEIRGEIDRCDDLYGVNYGQAPERLERVTLPPSEVPRDIALELARLDDNEVSTGLTTADGQNLIFLMLCGRTAELGSEEVSREDVAQTLRIRRLESFGRSLLEQLRAEATIVEQ